ncbi:tryptophan--tRNA ligase [Candidatus Shapirobacteria bacterium]|nr:tryptophan--tRNA ligase [Candidatus Shapirobacteria bacterium]
MQKSKNITPKEECQRERKGGLLFTPRILTGDRPTGKLHLGHLAATLEERVRLQDKYDTLILIADLQVLTDHLPSFREIEANAREVMLDYLGVGLKPEKTFVIQSQVPELMQLSYLFNFLVTVARAKRNPTLKAEIGMYGVSEMSLGMLTYPISQAADILLFKATLVPVGEDQLPHIEQTREIARAFNRIFRPIFPIPEGLVGPCRTLVGIDGKQKMSKSLGNAIYLSDSPEEVTRKIMKMYTDPARVRADIPGDPDKNPVFTYHRLFNADKDEVQNLEELYRQGKIGDKVVKERLAIAINKMLDPIRERRRYYENRPEEVSEILVRGRDRARQIGRKTIEEVMAAMGLSYSSLLPR